MPRLRVAVVLKIPVFGMTSHSETLIYVCASYPIPIIHIYVDYKLAGCGYVKLFELKILWEK
jgi:hypothetical protein